MNALTNPSTCSTSLRLGVTHWEQRHLFKFYLNCPIAPPQSSLLELKLLAQLSFYLLLLLLLLVLVLSALPHSPG
jgi:hypothetical protein